MLAGRLVRSTYQPNLLITIYTDQQHAKYLNPTRTQEPMFAPDIPVFAYGSLMVPDILRDALHLEPDSELVPRYKDAILLEYSKYRVIGAVFPAIAPCPGGSVTGRLIYLQDASQAAALDDMERVLYTKKEVLVETTNGLKHRAYTFVWNGRDDELDSDRDIRHSS
ncbi:hypothetical protein PILCRDRAFT_214530 [Piloderma croceum F 1598]|uniref:Putative gamma-glutamylcyclotransferase n=1 Tax=Piloderma croceum (strain F 1598) TaxID=765440 RepID=A0A0C3FYA3_PILCF|nr:hypothetical protein PILCRDRAFT_214530 [Piloderma croceum F 1598]